MMEIKAELLYEAAATLAEGPAWMAATEQLLWVDIEAGRIHCLTPQTLENQTWSVPGRVGFAVPAADGGIVAGTDSGLVRLSSRSGEIGHLFDPEPEQPANRFNDGKCDPQGRLWAGTMSLHETEGAGSLYRIEPDLRCTRILSGVTISNGLGWAPDQKTFYYIDTPTRRVDAFDYEPETGRVANRRPVIHIPDGIGFPDGMTVDHEGMLWIAMWTGWAVTRWDPALGKQLARIDLPVAKVTSCCFGGPQGRHLYITTARRDLTPEELSDQPRAGSLFIADPGVSGPAADSFGRPTPRE